MKQCIIACETLRDELFYAMRSVPITYDMLWIESGLHNTPKILHKRLQEMLDNVSGYQRVLLCFGACGNAALNLSVGDFELVMPRVDDCISLLIGSEAARQAISAKYAAYFLTGGWLRGERNLWVEYNYCINKYGEETAKEIAASMYGHYRTLGVLDTGIGGMEKLVGSTKIIADTLGLEQVVLPAGTEYLTQLLNGPWPPERFIVKQPHTAIESSDLYFSEVRAAANSIIRYCPAEEGCENKPVIASILAVDNICETCINYP